MANPYYEEWFYIPNGECGVCQKKNIECLHYEALDYYFSNSICFECIKKIKEGKISQQKTIRRN